MTCKKIVLISLFGGIFISCGWNLNAPDNGNGGSDPDTTAIFQNVTSSNLPDGLDDISQKARAADLDNDGDLDLIVAIQFQPNKLLLNDGNGRFSDESGARLPAQHYDTQDLTVADFNSDGSLDLFFVGNQNQTNELYLNDVRGSFSDLTNRIPVSGNSTSVESLDIDGDGSVDILIGNIGQNIILMNSGNAFFNNQTTQRLPQIFDATLDIEFGDINRDNLRDIIIGNENDNLLLVNVGSGFFSNQTATRIPFTNDVELTRDVDIVDVDGDGDRDLYFGNARTQNNGNPQDRLLINDGEGFFSDQTTDRLPAISTDTYDAEFSDVDQDGDPDLILGDFNGGLRLLINNGNGFFTDHSAIWIPENFRPRVTDLEIALLNDDSFPDIYISVANGQDQLLLQRN